jgi:hypothetical protein
MYTNIPQIEFDFNLDFRPEIANIYEYIIIEIFNGSDNYNNTTNSEIQTLLGIYYNMQNDHSKAFDYFYFAHLSGDLDATCTLAVFYYIYEKDKEKALLYFKHAADEGNILSSINLAYEYLLQGKIDLFLKYNQIGLDDNHEISLINQGLYYWIIIKDYNIANDLFNKAFKKNSSRAYFEYSKLINDIEIKKDYLLKAIKIKPKKIYIDCLKKLTNSFERYELYKKYNINTDIFINYDSDIINIKNKYNKCPLCINKKDLFVLKCNHSFCNDCIKKYNNDKCCICFN